MGRFVLKMMTFAMIVMGQAKAQDAAPTQSADEGQAQNDLARSDDGIAEQNKPVAPESIQAATMAQYVGLAGVSPFGGSLHLGYHLSQKNTVSFALGGLPGMTIDVDVGGTEYELESSSAWLGFFLHHRPVAELEWLRIVAGVGIGSIYNELTDPIGTRFRADYQHNPVGYVGVGYGITTKKGLQYGVDIGWLQTGGPEISQVGPAQDQEALDAIRDDFLFGRAFPNIQATVGWAL